MKTFKTIAPLPKTKMSKHGFMLYLVYLSNGEPFYVSIPD